MTPEETAIRATFNAWQRATHAGDLPALLEFMDDDVVFLTAGSTPMRKPDFAEAFKAGLGRVRIQYEWELRDVQVSNDLAVCWNDLVVTVSVAGGPPTRRVGSVLTVLRQNSSGRWVLFRDANLLTLEIAGAGKP